MDIQRLLHLQTKVVTILYNLGNRGLRLSEIIIGFRVPEAEQDEIVDAVRRLCSVRFVYTDLGVIFLSEEGIDVAKKIRYKLREHAQQN